MPMYDWKCCDACWHSPERPCHDLVECLTAGPLCHDDAACRERIQKRTAFFRRENPERPVIFIGAGTCGLGAGAARTIVRIKEYLAEKAIDADLVEVGCIGMCIAEPMVDVQMPGKTRVSFKHITGDKVDGLLDAVFNCVIPQADVMGQFRSDTLATWEGVPFLDELPFLKYQTRWVLANCGIVKPTSLEEYVARGGYRALAKSLGKITPRELCDMVIASGLRGRGGAGFPTGKKWKFALDTPNDQKYFVCNADEGDPGAFMDRAVIEGDPYRLLEGLCIGAYAIGASKAYVYLRAEYPLAIKHLEMAIEQAREMGLLGENILDSGFNLDVIIKHGAGAFVCGEETALLNSIEGRRGMPRPRPPYPAVSGLFEKPTVINNVETLANIPSLVDNGPEWFSAVGTATSKGTKVFALSGKIARTGLVEVAMGTPLRKIIFDIGGGCADGKAFKAVQIGGPSGGCIPTDQLDILIDYESLKTVGAMMGSGGMVVMDEDNCMVDVAKYFMEFIQRESCGKCIPCREGTKRMLEILKRITRGRRSEDKDGALERFQGMMYLTRLAAVIQDTSLCGLGNSAPNPVLSTLRWFRDEYEAHVYERRCPAGACTELMTFSIDTAKCKGCTLCAKKCPADAIMGSPKNPHYINPDRCISCGACAQVCRFDAVVIV